MGRRLTLVVPSLALGGAERVVANMANHWAAGGDTVKVITLSAATTDTYSLDPAVTRIALDLMRESVGRLRAIFNNWIRVRRLRDAITKSRPDTVISFTDRMNVVTLLACRKLDVDVVISERIDPSQHQIGRDWSALRQMLYSRARALVVQTDSVRGQMKSIMDGHPIYVIPNFVERPADRSSESHSKATGALQLAAMGRLDYQKGFDLLIDAFAQAAKHQPNWSLVILGEGPERQRLEEQIHARGLGPRVQLLGWVSDPSFVLRDSDAFVLSSRFEGFPNALLEAMSLGLPVIATDCPSGPAEIVRDEVDGLLVPSNDVPALSAAIRRVMSDDPLRTRLRKEAVQVVERFSTAKYFERWDEVLQKRGK
ncbi:MAG TPA: glycosyltransferase family 4 protein [Planctomycetaceae bacterium]|jgi:glycosyltransferase involved in cell wall biosynthesis|nr:glycosyltransferase family 4 protein [Planctomycetaceae bacterium]